MTKKSLDEKYSYQIDEHNVVHLFRGEDDYQQHLTNPLLSAIFKIEELEAQIEQNKIDLAISEHDREHDDYELTEVYTKVEQLEKENKTISRKANEGIADKLLITAKYNEVLNDLNQENDNLKKENAELKCECRTCVYTDSPCVRSDYPSKDGVCSHYKNVFDKIAELKQENKVLAQNLEDTEILNKTYEKRFSDLEKENVELKEDNSEWEKASDKWKSVYEITNNQLTKAKELLERLLITSCNSDVLRVRVEAEQFLKDSEVEK